MPIELGFIGKDSITRLTNNLATSFQQLSLAPVLNEVKGVIVDEVKLELSSQGRHTNEPWLPLADNSGRTPLDLTGKLRETATSPTLTVNNRLTIIANFSGQHSDLLKLHNEGKEFTRKYKKAGQKKIKIPKRRVIPPPEKYIEKVKPIVGNSLVDQISEKLKG